MSMESLYEYGSRAGVWRLLKLFKRHDIPLTVFAVAMAAQHHPEVIKAMVADGHEICSHGYRWIDYQYMDEAGARAHAEAIRILTGSPASARWAGTPAAAAPTPGVWCARTAASSTTRTPTMTTCPTGTRNPRRSIRTGDPYTLDTNDMRFTRAGLQQG